MRIRSNMLRELALARGLGAEQLAEVVSRTGLEHRPERGAAGASDPALSAVRNWMAGRDHPRCKASDVSKLARALGVPVSRLARFESRVAFHRGSPLKAKLLADLIRGRSFVEADNLLAFSTKRAASNMRKCLLAAMAEAQEAGADVGQLVVNESRVDGATHIKRFRPKDRGRAHPILKRQSHITISLVDPGTGRRRR